MKVINQSRKELLKFKEEIASVVLAKGVIIERLLATAKQLCEESRIVTEAAFLDGEQYRKTLATHSEWEMRDVKSQQHSVSELRHMATFLPRDEVPIGNLTNSHFERFALFAKLELKQALGVIQETNQKYINMLEFFGEDTNTKICASDFFSMLDAFMKAFDKGKLFVW